jgi:signal transduction histidine kinase
LNRSFRLWFLFGLFLVLGVGAMVWITRATLRMEKAEIEARLQAALEQRIRLSLERMDSTLAPVVALESARPYFHFNAFYSADQAFSRMFTKAGTQGIQIPSPLLLAEEPHILLHFQVDPDDRFSSPMAPGPKVRDLAMRAGADQEKMRLASLRLEELRGALHRDEIRTLMFQNGAILQTREQIQNLRNDQNLHVPGGSTTTSTNAWNAPIYVNQQPFTPIWCGRRLILARQVWVGDQEYIQGCWLDWASIRLGLLNTILDLLPKSDLVPPSGPSARRLATLPILLLPGDIPPEKHKRRSPVRIALIFGWSCALLAGLAGAIVLQRANQLSERRGAFVSAVTHELRTPLTTFRLYTEMLLMGMVHDDAERQSFLQILAVEADRLDHLVKNVLSFARLEAKRTFASLERTSLENLLDRHSSRLLQRAKQGDMELRIELPDELRELQVFTDPSVVEQILFNLVDNACKYATGDVRRITISATRNNSHARLCCQDQGPGISPEDRKRLFRPFSKSAQRAARSAPGVGLGLALCRRLARSMGGDLRFDGTVQEGACFVLKVPVA